jgi:phosphonatase-like hydrolase
MAVKLAVFDIAGTTIADDNAVAAAFSNAFLKYGFDVKYEEISPLMGYKKPVAIRTMLERKGATIYDSLVDDIYQQFEADMLDHYEYSPEVKALPGAEEVMLELKQRGIRIGLNTGFSRAITDKIVNRLQWIDRGLVDDYVASDEVEEGRPQPLMIRSLMKRAGIDDPSEVIKIGDTEVDVREGINAGCLMVIAVTTGAFTRAELEDYGPDHIIDDLSELPALIFDRE